jgi:hypothetical protein
MVPKTPEIAGKDFSASQNSAAGTVAARGFTRRRQKLQNTGDLECLLPLYLPTPAVSNTVTCKTPRNANSKVSGSVSLFQIYSLLSSPFGSVLPFFRWRSALRSGHLLLLCFGWQIGRCCHVPAAVECWPARGE